MPKFNSPAYTLLHYSCGFFAPDANHSTRKPSYLRGSCQRSFQDLENTFQSFLVEHCSSRSCGGSWRSSSVHCIPFARGNGFVLSRLDSYKGTQKFSPSQDTQHELTRRVNGTFPMDGLCGRRFVSPHKTTSTVHQCNVCLHPVEYECSSSS